MILCRKGNLFFIDVFDWKGIVGVMLPETFGLVRFLMLAALLCYALFDYYG